MVSLVDIGPAIDTAEIRGQAVDIYGLSAKSIVDLFIQYPEIRRVVTGKADEDVLAILFQQMPHLIDEVVASCCYSPDASHHDISDVKKAVKNLTLGEKWIIMEKAMKITFPQGPKNFLDGLFALTGQPAPDVSGRLGWVADTTSQQPSSSVSAQDDAKPTAGEAPPSNSQPGASS